MLVPGPLLCFVLLSHLVEELAGSPLAPLHQGVSLNEFISYFEPAQYDLHGLRTQHRRMRRSVGAAQPPLRITVHSHGRAFRLLLRPDHEVFAPDADFESTRGPVTFDPGKAYFGTLEDDPSAEVRAVVTSEGLLDATVSTRLGDLYIEPASRYLGRSPGRLHSVAYWASDVRPPKQPDTCASQRLHRNASSVREASRRRRRWLPELELLDARVAYDLGPLVGDANTRPLYKRAAVDPKKTTCMLYLQADHLFFQKYGTEEACIEVMTRHVQRVNTIYKNTDFNQDGKPDNISFMIKRIKVHTPEAAKDTGYRFPLNYGVEKFLELFSEEDYDAFCLAYMFTYRDFEMGTLGLAWTGDLKNAGGVCEKNGMYRGSMKSLNTGIVTLLNYGKHVPPAVSHVTLAHEIGHNFGSPHDPEFCTPGGDDGNFIMFARATSGDKKNNNKFSPCSLKSINPVLNVKARSPKGCFTEPQVALCGNGVVEEGEECDCGWEDDCHDQCCYPQRRFPSDGEPPCKLTPNSVCSPSQGPCCTNECTLRFGDECREDNGCRESSQCDGRRPQCPPSINKPNKTLCNKEFVCFMGECTGSICLAYGLELCQCIPGPQDPKTKACELCCKLPGDNEPCRSSFEWNIKPYDVPDMFSKPGTPCNNYNGYCDVFQKCREVDPSGPLATLRKLLLSEESIATFKIWVADHWYAVFFIVIVIIALLVASTKLLGKKTDLKMKAVTIIHSSTTETVRLPPEGDAGQTGQVTVHPAAVRSKLPLKRRVREARSRHRSKNNNNVTKKQKPKKVDKTATSPVTIVKSSSADETPSSQPTPSPRKTKKKPPKPPPIKTKKKKKKTSKEVIDYSGAQGVMKTDPILGITVKTNSTENDPVGKVKNWLLSSQPTVDLNFIPKSKSTPVGLASGNPRSPVKLRATRHRTEKAKSRSTGNLQSKCSDKVRLQVVYKPPFKFSLKLRKAETPSSVVIVDRSRRKTQPLQETAAKGKRTAVLLRTSKPSPRKAPYRKSHPPTSAKEPPIQPLVSSPVIPETPVSLPSGNNPFSKPDDIDSNIHTFPSDLEVLLSESEFLFSDA